MSQLTDKERINDSGLFFFDSTLSDSQKLEILDWFQSLGEKEKLYINMLRKEATEKAEYFNQDND